MGSNPGYLLKSTLSRFLVLFTFIISELITENSKPETFYICHHSLISNFFYYFFLCFGARCHFQIMSKKSQQIVQSNKEISFFGFQFQQFWIKCIFQISNNIRLSSSTRETNAGEIHSRQLTVEGGGCLNFSDLFLYFLDLGFS